MTLWSADAAALAANTTYQRLPAVIMSVMGADKVVVLFKLQVLRVSEARPAAAAQGATTAMVVPVYDKATLTRTHPPTRRQEAQPVVVMMVTIPVMAEVVSGCLALVQQRREIATTAEMAVQVAQRVKRFQP
jgi:hypothetical protein